MLGIFVFSHVFPIFGVACITAPVFLFKGVECCIVKALESACAATLDRAGTCRGFTLPERGVSGAIGVVPSFGQAELVLGTEMSGEGQGQKVEENISRKDA